MPRDRSEYEITDCDCCDETPMHRLCSHCRHHRKLDERERDEADEHNTTFREGRSR
jgi:hypothetical protein